MSGAKQKITKAGNPNGRKPLHDWLAVKQYFIEESLRRDERVPLKEVAAKFEISYGMVKHRASAEKWTFALNRSQQVVAAKVEEKMVDLTVLDQLSARLRKAERGIMLMDKATAKLGNVPAEELTTREALQYMTLGDRMVDGAVGIAKRMDITTAVAHSDDYESVADKIRRHGELNCLGEEFLRYLKRRRGEVIDAKPLAKH
jgi:hypothetical protein